MNKTWLKLGLIALFLVGLVWVLKAAGIDLTKVTPERIRDLVLSFGVWAPAIYLLAYGQPIIPLPASIMTITGGLAFGPLWGTLAALGGATIRACSQFAIARLFGQQAVTTLLKGRVAALDQKLGQNSFKAVFLIRLIPNFPFDVQNYGLGFSRVRFIPYVLGTILGMPLGAFVFANLGSSLTDPRRIWKLCLAVFLIIVFSWSTSAWKRRRAVPPGSSS